METNNTFTHECPRSREDGRPTSPAWRDDETCSYCGSLNPDVFMKQIEDGTIELGTTTKNYKVYIHADQQEGMSKFYFQHLSEDQKKRFVELLGERAIKFHHGYEFTVLPFFVSRIHNSR
jgi:hypothetical protein